MLIQHFHRLGLCNEQSDIDLPTGSGGAGAAAATEGEGQTTTTPAAAEDNPQLTMRQRLSAALSTKSNLLAKIGGLEARVKELEGALEKGNTERAELDKKYIAAQERIQSLEGQLKEVEDALKAAEDEAKDLQSKEQDISKRAEQMTKEKVGALGFPASQLPAATDKATHEAAVDDLKAQFEKEQDPAKKAQLRVRLRELREQAANGTN